MAEQKCKHCGRNIERRGAAGGFFHTASGLIWCCDVNGDWNRAYVSVEPATPSGEVAQRERPVHSKGSAVVQEQWERSKWSHDGNWRESLGDWAADLLTEYAAKYGPIDAAQPEPQPAGTGPRDEHIAYLGMKAEWDALREYLGNPTCYPGTDWSRTLVDDVKAHVETQLAALKQSHEALAHSIASALFTNGAGQVAERLVLELLGKRDGGGWCRAAVEDVIIAALESK
jgi:hypothetical protein